MQASGGDRRGGATSRVASTTSSRLVLFALLGAAALSLLLMACGGSSEGGNNGGGGDEEQLSFNPSTTRAGQNVTVRGIDLPELEQNTIVRAELLATSGEKQVSLGNVNIVNGIFTISVFIPEDMEAGTYTVELAIKGEGQPEEPITAQLTVVDQ